MDDGGSNFLFRLPNSIRKLHSNKLLFYGLALLICGIISVANGTQAMINDATKSYQLVQYVNTHWITSVFLLAGLSTILAERLRINFFLFSSICFVGVSMSVAFGSFLFDCMNLNVVSNADKQQTFRIPYINDRQRRAMIAYSAIDLITCAAAFVSSVLTILEIKSIGGRYFQSVPELKCKSVLAAGAILCLIGEGKEILWIMELVWLRDVGEAIKYIFLNYTLDEPVWNVVYILTGAMNIAVSMTGSRVVSYCALALTSLSAFPVVQYLWIDYRWMMTIKITELVTHVPKPHTLLQANIGISVIHLVVILVTCGLLIKHFMRNSLPWTSNKIAIDANLRQTILFLGMLTFSAGVVFMITDVVNIMSGTFFRMFYPTEQKLPFYLAPVGVLCLVVVRFNDYIPLMVPSVIVLLLLTMQATAFHISTYLYLSHNLYFDSQICDLFFFGKIKCTSKMERTGAFAHFFEAAMAVSVLILSLYGVFVFCRMCTLFSFPLKFPLTGDEDHRKRRFHLCARLLAAVQFALGIAVCIISLFLHDRDPSDYFSHPLIVIHTIIHRTTLSLLLIIFPLVQLTLAVEMHVYPMKALTCIAISCVRMTDILIQLDYRNLTYLGTAWTVMTAIEFVTLILQFGVMTACAALLDLGLNRLPQLELTLDDEAQVGNGFAAAVETSTAIVKDSDEEARYKRSETDEQNHRIERTFEFESFSKHPDDNLTM